MPGVAGFCVLEAELTAGCYCRLCGLGVTQILWTFCNFRDVSTLALMIQIRCCGEVYSIYYI